jgi:hypothetical protein
MTNSARPQFEVTVVLSTSSSGGETTETYTEVGNVAVIDGHLVLHAVGENRAVAGYAPGKWVRFRRNASRQG